ncbi:MAG: carbon monoxide dehydrogenase [Catenulispora sp. 13_1_20CM_3_70_7]|nr:FAD binding domain-containing protein [Catenulisporales bacterium]OLE27698.1 MAG: carbon monoxide dehydrogenase [Catenulispora sp. 13_1_20CM_3_70_7]
MEFLAPADWAEAVQAKAAHPEAVPIAGGTDVMVELNFDLRRPTALLDLGRVAELRDWEVREGVVRIGAAVTFARLLRADLAGRLPALAMAARTVGSPQIRNRATVGGNLGTASPAGDAHPALLATGAVVEAESVRGPRLIPIAEFFTGVKRSALAPDELIKAVSIPEAAGPQQFAKVGSRNAMVIAVCSLSLALDPDRRTVGTGIGSAGPTPVTAPAAERFLAEELDWDRLTVSAGAAMRFGRLVAQAASPIDDVRGTAAYRRHALAVLAVRTLHWTSRREQVPV